MRLAAFLLAIAPVYGAITNLQVAGTTSTQAVLSYTPPDSNPCSLEVSESPAFTPLVHDVDIALFPGSSSDARSGNVTAGKIRTFVVGKRSADIASDNLRYSRALQANTPHYFRLTCGTDQVSGTFTTANIPIGNTYPEVPPVDAANPGEYSWPYMPWSATNPSMIDPQTGVLFKPITRPRRSYVAFGPIAFGAARDTGGLGEWVNPSYALANSSGRAAVYSGTQRSWLWLQTSNFQTPNDSGGDWSAEGYSINYFEPQFKIWASDGQAEVCLTSNGLTCKSVVRTITVPTNEPGAVQTVGDTNTPMVYWNDALHIVSKPNMVRRNGYVNVDAGGNVMWASGDKFNVNWTAGSRLTIAGVDCPIVSFTNNVSLKANLAGCAGLSAPKTGVAYSSDNFGVLIRPHSPNATLSIKAAQYLYEESTDTSWVAGDMTVMCSDTLVPDNSVPPQYGYHCTIGGLVWINPMTGESRSLGDYTRPSGGNYSGDTLPSGNTCLSDANPFAADGNTEYCLASATGGPILMKGVYSGNNRDIGLYTYGTQAAPMVWSNMTPMSQRKGLLDLLQGFDSTFDRTLFTTCYVRGLTGDRTKVAGECRRDAQQDVIAWLWIFDPSAQSIIGAWPTWKAPASRWCRVHSYAQVVGSPVWVAGEFSLNNRSYQSSGSGNGAGPWYTTITSGPLAATGTIASGAAVPDFTGLSCPTGYTGCDIVTVAGEPCDFDPGSTEPRNCPYNSSAYYLQDALPGDLLQFDTGTGGQQEMVKLLAKSGNSWVIVRGYWAAWNYLTQSHAAGSKLQEQCGNGSAGPVDTTLWNFFADPHAQDASATTVIPDGHFFNHGAYAKTVGAGGAQWQDCPPNTNGNCVSIKKGADVPDYANQRPNTLPTGLPAFASQQSTGVPADIYVAPGPTAPAAGTPGDYVIMARPLESDSSLNAVTPITGQLSKVTVNYSPLRIKTFPTLALCGMHPLVDVSGPASTIASDSSGSFKYCVANSAGECQSGSKTGDVYVNCPFSSNQGCTGNEDDRGICIAPNSTQVQKVSQVSTTIRAPNGSDTRILTSAFHPYRVGPYYWNARVLADGSWAVVRAPFFNQTRAELFLAKLPPLPAPDSVARSTFVPVTLKFTPPPGLAINNAIVEFGYAENGAVDSYYCTTRDEACIASASTITEVSPFAYAGEGPSGAACTSGCTIQIPGISQRIVYYRVKYRDASNQVLATGATQVAIIP